MYVVYGRPLAGARVLIFKIYYYTSTDNNENYRTLILIKPTDNHRFFKYLMLIIKENMSSAESVLLFN